MDKLNDKVSDVAIASAVYLGQQGTAVPKDKTLHTVVGPVLGEFGLLRGDSTRVCAIERSFERLIGQKLPAVNWRRILARNYRRVERQAVFCYAYAAADTTSWVNAMDVFNDALLVGLSQRDGDIGTYQKGSVGSFVVSGSSRFALKYPYLYLMVKSIHDKRGESALSHAWQKSGTTYVKATSYIKYSYIGTGKKLIFQAIAELAKEWPA
jgi:hypothetical protein